MIEEVYTFIREEHPIKAILGALAGVFGGVLLIVQFWQSHDANKFVKRDITVQNLTTQIENLTDENSGLSERVESLKNEVSILKQEYQIESDGYVRKIGELDTQSLMFYSRLAEYRQFLDALLVDEFSSPQAFGDMQLQNNESNQLTPYLGVELKLLDDEFVVRVNDSSMPASVGEDGVFLTSAHLCKLAVTNDDTTLPQPARTMVPAIRVELDWKCWRRH